jgi:U4/U6.U5 tri-snRNP component SNU23
MLVSPRHKTDFPFRRCLQEKSAEELALDARKRRRMERDPLHQGIIVQRANLKARDAQIDLAANLGRSQMYSLTAPLSQQAGYYCDVCDCVLKDSLAYLDHINGKWHNRALGMSMRVEKSTADQVRRRLEEAKRRKRGEMEVGNAEEYVPDGMNREELRLQGGDILEEDDQDKGVDNTRGSIVIVSPEEEGDNRKGKEEDADQNQEGEEGGGADIAALMGFGGFGGSKKG